MTHISELTTQAEFIKAYPVMATLRDHLTQSEYTRRITQMREEGYRMFALRQPDDTILALAGFKIFTTLYSGHTLHIYDLVTTTSQRGQGRGQALMQHIDAFAHENGCDAITLDSGLQRADAHRFYEAKAHMPKTGYTFRKDL